MQHEDDEDDEDDDEYVEEDTEEWEEDESDEEEDEAEKDDGAEKIPAKKRAHGHEPVVALVGLPNCGKSTFFNRLVRQNKSLISSVPGTTRDRVYASCDIGGRSIMVKSQFFFAKSNVNCQTLI